MSTNVKSKQSNRHRVKADVIGSAFRIWEVYEVLPLGWKIDNSCGSPLHGFDFCTNGKSILNGGKRALVRWIRKGTPRIQFVEPTKQSHIVETNEMVEKTEIPIFPAKTVNNLARLKFKEQLLKEIMFDLMVCEIEKWDKKEYINEIKKLLNSIDTSNKKKVSTSSMTDLFSAVGL
jgi:hypothetical protein